MKKDSTKYLKKYILYLLAVWWIYRYFFQFGEVVEELVIKPIVWIFPILFILKREKSKLASLGLTSKNLFPALYYSLAFGAFFAMEALIISILKHGGINFAANIGDAMFFTALGLSFATAISEELVFRGYIFGRLLVATKNEWIANFVSSGIWGLIHAPISIFVWKLDSVSIFTYLFLVVIFGIGSSFVFARTKNIFSSILLHVFWSWPIILFR